MALVVETGAGLETANTYAAAATVLDYCNARGLPNFAALAADAQEPCILRAMRWLEGFYRNRWRGQRAKEDQALAWPRVNVVDQDGYSVESDEIPQEVISALCEAAEREAAGVGTLDPDLDRGGMVTQEVIGPISVSYHPNAPGGSQFPAINQLLSGLTRSGLMAAVGRG